MAGDQFRKRRDGDLAPHLRLGMLGEQAAARELRRAGLKILFTNFQGPKGGELDIVCREGAVLVFVEVKTRRTEDLVTPGAAVDAEKQVRLLDGGREWLKLLGDPDINFRFDIVEVLWPDPSSRRPAEIRHHRNCFTFPPHRHYQPAAKKPWER
jgi:putative endonuclease